MLGEQEMPEPRKRRATAGPEAGREEGCAAQGLRVYVCSPSLHRYPRCEV